MVFVSIDAYRSTRVKEAERPGVKQVIVRKEDVCVRAQEPPDSSIFSLKHKMKVWDVSPEGPLSTSADH